MATTAKTTVRREQAPSGRKWPADVQHLLDFLEFASGQVPRSPFWLYAGVFVRDPARFLGCLRVSAAAGPDGPRAGPLLRDLRRLRELFGRKATERRRELLLPDAEESQVRRIPR